MQAQYPITQMLSVKSRFLPRAVACKMNIYAYTAAQIKKHSTSRLCSDVTWVQRHFGVPKQRSCTVSEHKTALHEGFSTPKISFQGQQLYFWRCGIGTRIVGQAFDINIENWMKETSLHSHLRAISTCKLSTSCICTKQQQEGERNRAPGSQARID
jgi:hypothetical protein